MTKKGKVEEAESVDYRVGLTRRLEIEFLRSRFEAMGELQNRIVGVIGEASLPPQETYFVLQRVADNVMENFNELISSKQAQAKEVQVKKEE